MNDQVDKIETFNKMKDIKKKEEEMIYEFLNNKRRRRKLIYLLVNSSPKMSAFDEYVSMRK